MGSFLVEDAFQIAGRGWVVTGHGLDGEIVTGDVVHTLTEDDQPDREFTIVGIERFVIDVGKPVREGDRAGLLLREMRDASEVPPGTILAHYDYVL